MIKWIIRSPFKTRTWEKVLATGSYTLYGIRNHQSRAAVAAMQPTDRCLFYFNKALWGTMEVAASALPDLTDTSGAWLSIELKPVQTFAKPIGLNELTRWLPEANFLRQPRVSVMPLSEAEVLILADAGIHDR